MSNDTRLSLIRYSHTNKHSKKVYLFKCVCGNEKLALLSEVKSGHVKSCGCLVKDTVTKHGMANTREYQTWADMKGRCFNTNHNQYKDWGGRGITVCERWKDSFINFYNDMGNKPHKMSLERINNDGNYEPSNCKWATQSEQNKNQRRSYKPGGGKYVNPS